MAYQKGENLKLICEQTIFIDDTVKIGNNVTIYENNRIMGNSVIGDNVVLLPGNYIVSSEIKAGATVQSSNLDNAIVGEGTSVGPFSRLRPKAVIGKNCKIGNFVEVKNSNFGDGSKASHLAYVGDADVGENCNIGCGVIFVNYNGKSKSRAVIGDNCFVGSNANVIAPVNVAKNTYICAGTTVTSDTAEFDFVIGRTRQEVKPNRAQKYLKEIK